MSAAKKRTSASWALGTAALLIPLAGGALGGWAGLTAGLSPAGATVLATLAASASYIAVPAAMRMTVPEANPSFYISTALGVTFPFNIIVGIPIYMALVNTVLPAAP